MTGSFEIISPFPNSDIPKCQKEYFSLFPSSLFHVILLCVCVLCVCCLEKACHDLFASFPEKSAALLCVLVLEPRLAPKSEKFRKIWQSARGTDEGQTRNVSLDSKENEKRIRLQTHTHKHKQRQTRFRSARKRNQHAEMGTGHIFSHKFAVEPKEKKKIKMKSRKMRKQEHKT